MYISSQYFADLIIGTPVVTVSNGYYHSWPWVQIQTIKDLILLWQKQAIYYSCIYVHKYVGVMAVPTYVYCSEFSLKSAW